MVWLFLLNDRHYLALGEGYMPSKELLLRYKNAVSMASPGGNHKDLSRDLLTAFAMNLLTRVYTESQDYERDNFPLETWVIRPSEDGSGRMADWFKHTPDAKRYRLFIHRNPSRYKGRQVGLDIWYHAYRALGIRPVTSHLEELKDQASDFLDDLIKAYDDNPHAPEEIIRDTGQPYALCRNPR